jgi:hypothetical protein
MVTRQTWHSITVFISEVLFLFLCLRFLFYKSQLIGLLIDTTTINMSSKDITSHVPLFIGQDFRFWKEKMEDYLGAQRLLGYALGQCQRPVAANAVQPTQAKLVAMANWDKIDLQVKSMITMRLSTSLRTLCGTQLPRFTAMACRWPTSPLMVYGTPSWQSGHVQPTPLSSRLPTTQIKFLWSNEKVSLPISKSRGKQTQLPIQPLKLLMVSRAVRGQERVVNERRLVNPELPTTL